MYKIEDVPKLLSIDKTRLDFIVTCVLGERSLLTFTLTDLLKVAYTHYAIEIGLREEAVKLLEFLETTESFNPSSNHHETIAPNPEAVAHVRYFDGTSEFVTDTPDDRKEDVSGVSILVIENIKREVFRAVK